MILEKKFFDSKSWNPGMCIQMSTLCGKIKLIQLKCQKKAHYSVLYKSN